MKLILFGIFGILTLSNTAYAQTPADYCRVWTSTTSTAERVGTGVTTLGEFRPISLEVITDKSFKHEASGLTIDAEVEYFEEKGKPYEIRLTLDVSNKEQKVLNSIDNSVAAATSYGRRWGRVSVRKSLTVGDLIYHFVFTCNDGSKVNRSKVNQGMVVYGM